MGLQPAFHSPQVEPSLLPNLAANEIVRDISVINYGRGQPYNEREFMAEFFARWLERDTKSDDRASRHKPTLLPEYVRLLEFVAVNTVLEGSMDESGYFDVGNDWIFTSLDGDTPVRAMEILKRSGLVSVDPRDPCSERFRFEPFWLHRMLVEQFLLRRSDGSRWQIDHGQHRKHGNENPDSGCSVHSVVGHLHGQTKPRLKMRRVAATGTASSQPG